VEHRRAGTAPCAVSNGRFVYAVGIAPSGRTDARGQSAHGTVVSSNIDQTAAARLRESTRFPVWRDSLAVASAL
jgi:hypothetical protein